MVCARLHRHVERGATRPLAGLGERDDLAVAPVRLGRALADDAAVRDDDGPDRRLRIRPAVRFRCELQCPLQAHASACTSRRYVRVQVLEAEDAGADDEQVRPGLVRGADVLRLDAAVDLDEAVDELARACEPLVGVLHELLAPVARVDRHAEAEIGALVGGLGSHLDRRLGTEGDPDLEPVLARAGDHVADVVHSLDVEGDAVAARLGDLLEVVRRVVDHQVAVDPAAEVVDVRRDRAQHDRADRHRWDEMPVADVEVEDACAGVSARCSICSPSRQKSAA